MKFVSNWSCFKGTNIDVKKFYLKLISRIVMCTTLKNAEIVIKNVLITSNSLYEGYNDYNTPSESEKSKILLKKQIAGMDEIEIEDEEDDSIPQELDEEEDIDVEDSEEPKKKEDEEKDEQPKDIEEEFESDVDDELDDGTDYNKNYFDNGEGFDDDDDGLDDNDAIY